MPPRVDWREYLGVALDQSQKNSSAAHACTALLSYYERRSTGVLFEPSRSFVYYTASRLSAVSGGSETSLRTTWKAILQFGVPSEEHWPYDEYRLSQEPDAFVYGAARLYESALYVRLDAEPHDGDQTLDVVKSFLAAGYPSVFGFSVCRSVPDDGNISFPTVFDSFCGGQAVLALGYDDQRRIRSEKGALLIRNSWGPNWGDQGYGWLPYAYVRRRLAVDFWTLVSPDWIASGEFVRPF